MRLVAVAVAAAAAAVLSVCDASAMRGRQDTVADAAALSAAVGETDITDAASAVSVVSPSVSSAVSDSSSSSSSVVAAAPPPVDAADEEDGDDGDDEDDDGEDDADVAKPSASQLLDEYDDEDGDGDDDEDGDEDVATVRAQMVDRGTLSGAIGSGGLSPDAPVVSTAAAVEAAPPPARPAMVLPGHFAAERRARRRAENAYKRAMEEAQKATVERSRAAQEAAACVHMSHTRTLAQFLVEQEDGADGSSKELVLDLINGVCPALKKRFALAFDDVDCGKLAQQVADYYNERYVGELPQTVQDKCAGKPIKVRNYAVSQLVHSANNLFDVDFCADETGDVDACPAAAAAAAAAAADPTSVESDASVAAAVAAVDTGATAVAGV